MPLTSQFYRQCQKLFERDLGYGRRWKSAAAQALEISRATLYRYFDNDDGVPDDVRSRLRELAQPQVPIYDDQEMVRLYARGLVELQERIDAEGWLKPDDGYPSTLQRVFDIAAAQQAVGADSRWPTGLTSLGRLAEVPLYQWKLDLSWDPAGDYTAASLTRDGEITQDCAELAAKGVDPEAEIIEGRGFELLMSVCRDRVDGQRVYTTFRRFIIEHPVFDNAAMEMASAPLLTSVQRANELLNAFYQPVPKALSMGLSLPICKISGTILRRQRTGLHTEHRDPQARLCAKSSDHNVRLWQPSTRHLRRAFRRYWCLPGLAEIALADALEDAGWNCDLWPNFDAVDLVATSPDGKRRVAVDVKDYLSPSLLAKRFGSSGFGQYADTHECYLVIPDYLPEATADYERRFDTARDALGRSRIALRTVSSLLSEVGARA